jgi:hypothetical protein
LFNDILPSQPPSGATIYVFVHTRPNANDADDDARFDDAKMFSSTFYLLNRILYSYVGVGTATSAPDRVFGSMPVAGVYDWARVETEHNSEAFGFTGLSSQSFLNVHHGEVNIRLYYYFLRLFGFLL